METGKESVVKAIRVRLVQERDPVLCRGDNEVAVGAVLSSALELREHPELWLCS